MATTSIVRTAIVDKAPTGIAGFDEISGGGLPRGGTTLVERGPGSGKTIFALQTLVNGAREQGEPGIFIAFEERADRIVRNAAKLGWDLPALQRSKLFILDAQPRPDVVQSGSFDLGGLLAAVEAKTNEIGARRIVFDALDVVLNLLTDPKDVRREVYRLHDWLLSRGLSAIITAKAGPATGEADGAPAYGFMQFMVDCSMLLSHRIVQGVSQRNLCILKYRGTAFEENETPFVIGPGGIEVAALRIPMTRAPTAAEDRRVSTGVARLDKMLAGGYYRGSSVLITGSPGTAKSTLGGAFVAAACRRGERAMFVSFDSDGHEVVRNLASVNIRLQPYVQKGLLHMVSARTISGSAEIHLMQIRDIARAHRARCIVVDPVSALSKQGNAGTIHSVAERLIDWAKTEGITLVCTSLLEGGAPEIEGSPLQISTIADTWIHLSYLVRAGERNRGLSIIKSRGTAHSNQVRELLLADGGVTLADVYTGGGEVLMGTLRWEKEQAVRQARIAGETTERQLHARFLAEEAEIEARLTLLQRTLQEKRAELKALDRQRATRDKDRVADSRQIDTLRGSDERKSRRAKPVTTA